MGENDANGGLYKELKFDDPIHAALAAAAEEPLFPVGNPRHREKRAWPFDPAHKRGHSIDITIPLRYAATALRTAPCFTASYPRQNSYLFDESQSMRSSSSDVLARIGGVQPGDTASVPPTSRYAGIPYGENHESH